MGGRGASSGSIKTIKYSHRRGSITAQTYSKLPKGWVYDDNATTAPQGYRWASNNKSRFSGQRKSALIKQ